MEARLQTSMKQPPLLSMGQLVHFYSGTLYEFLQQKCVFLVNVHNQMMQPVSSSNLLLPPSVHAQTLRLAVSAEKKKRSKNEIRGEKHSY